jgi:pimeloyl-ACP methyl ester carboxylesterase
MLRAVLLLPRPPSSLRRVRLAPPRAGRAACRGFAQRQGAPPRARHQGRATRGLATAAGSAAAGSTLLSFVTPMTFGGTMIAFLGLPYLAILLLLVTQQRALIFPRPSQVASSRDHHGGRLVTVPTPDELPEGAGEVGTTMAAIFFPPPTPDDPVVVYWHGNADQIGWGGAYVGALLREHKLGTYAVEYPGYGHARHGVSAPSEEAMYTAAELMVEHLTKPKSDGGLGVPPDKVVLMGQSIGGSVALELAARGHGAALLLLCPFSSLSAMVDVAFPIVTPALRIFPFLLLDKFDNLGKAETGIIGAAKNVAELDTASRYAAADSEPEPELEPQRRLPILLAHGTEDEIVPFAQGKELAAALGAQMVVLENAGHNNVLSSPHWDKFANALTRFLKKSLP